MWKGRCGTLDSLFVPFSLHVGNAEIFSVMIPGVLYGESLLLDGG